MQYDAEDPKRQELLKKCRPEDFDGHTDFQKLSPVEKLHWLSTTAVFLHSLAKNNPDLGCTRFFE